MAFSEKMALIYINTERRGKFQTCAQALPLMLCEAHHIPKRLRT
jgi:hypothetical protein